MTEPPEYLERERQRLDSQVQQLARDKERILPKPRHADPPQTPDPTMRDFRKWQWCILGLLLLVNVSGSMELVRYLQGPPDTFRVVVDESQVRRYQNTDTGNSTYVIEMRSQDVRPYFRWEATSPLLPMIVSNSLLVCALGYTRYRMRRAQAEAKLCP